MKKIRNQANLKKGYVRIFTAFILVLTLFLSALPNASAYVYYCDWNEDNSVFCFLRCEEDRTFSPDDFPEVKCSKVVMTGKGYSDQSYRYTVILVLEEGLVDDAITALDNNTYVSFAEKNTNHQQFTNYIAMLQGVSDIKIGQKIEVGLWRYKLYNINNYFDAVTFSIDTEKIDNTNITIESFKEYGITSFVALQSTLEGMGSETEKRVGIRSEAGCYRAIEFGDQTAIDLADKLARTPGITLVQLNAADGYVGGPAIPFIWTQDYFCVDMEEVNREKVIVTGLEAGETMINLEVITPLETLTQQYYVKVLDEHRDGDVNADALINSADALVALQNAVNIVELDDVATGRSDVDKDGKITATDALCILQFSVTEFADGGLIGDWVKSK